MRTLGLAAALTLALAAPAQQIVAPETAGRGAIVAAKDGLVLPAGEFAVADLIDAVATFLCRNYLYDHAAVERLQGFTLHKSIALDALGAEEVLHALLATRELASLPVDELRGLHQIVSLNANQGSLAIACAPWRSPEEILGRPRLQELVVTAIELRNADANQIAAGLRSHFATCGQWRPGMLVAHPSGPRLLLVHGYRDVVAQVVLLARQIDKATDPPEPTLLQRLDALQRQVDDLSRQLAARPH